MGQRPSRPSPRDFVPTVPVTGRADLTDTQWKVQEPLLPRGNKPGRPPKRSRFFGVVLEVHSCHGLGRAAAVVGSR